MFNRIPKFNKSKICLIVLGCILFCMLLTIITYDSDIHDATYSKLVKIDGIGPVLAKRIIAFSDRYPNATLKQFIRVKGIGKAKLRELQEHFK